MKISGFIIALFGAIVSAYLFPSALIYVPVDPIIAVGIALIFFFYGLKLAPAELKMGFLNYPSHFLIQITTFIIFPLLSLAFIPVFKGGSGSELWLAVLFLGALPSTVSSSVVMVALAKGNLPTAIFNSSISGLIGIIATPLWLSIFLVRTGEFEILDVVLKLFLQILLPLITGLFLQRYLGGLTRKYSSQLSFFDKSVIVLIVYSSFSNSFDSNIFSTVDHYDLLKLSGIVIFLFFIVYFLLDFLCKRLNFNMKDTITVKFTGSQKSLVHGSVMAKIIFGNSAGLGIFLLPIMLYHILQLVLISVFAENYRKKMLKKEG